jgi:polyisoprenoid-binding protein YceI
MIRFACPLMLLAALMLAATPVLADEWEVDVSHSSVVFKVSHLDVSNQHGRFNEIAGSLNTGDAAAFKFIVPTASIDTNNAKRDDHLRSPDFFNAKQFPVIGFKGESITANEDGMELAGELTLHGVTQPLTVQMTKVGEGEDPWGGYRIGLETTFTIQRSAFGMDQMLNAVGDEVELTISIEALRK